MSGVQGEHPICSALMARARRISSADTEILDFAFFLELLEFAPVSSIGMRVPRVYLEWG